ncbi:HpcH/HpaI aldolase/citrate lyase family protein [Aeromicrobium sp. A1-2]|uniref:HpcH/HpaI aldolase family protein n=1 Tax=Aeromicrobium sp. A1-2 TaxID=2107713 RepID=UPI0013C37A4D|nr:aldolase/citrate lyase family protein [Aeromicrobium sp. A1-2]
MDMFATGCHNVKGPPSTHGELVTSQRISLNLNQDRPLVGVVLKMPCPAVVEMAGHCNADLVIIDTEHGAGSDTELEHHVRAADSAGIPVLVRVPANETPYIQAALDAGAVGVVVPHVSSVADAQRATTTAHYPPFGHRGLALTTRAGGQGTAQLEAALADARQNTIVICQIEDMPGVEAVDDILGVDGVSGIWIGSNDLSMSMRDPAGHLDSAAAEAAVAVVSEAVAGSPKVLAMLAPPPAAMSSWRARGADILLITGHDLMAKSLTAYIGTAASIDDGQPSAM